MHIFIEGDDDFKATQLAIRRIESSVNTLRERSDMAFQDLMSSVSDLGDTLRKIDGDVTKLNGAVATLQTTVNGMKDNLTKEQQDQLQAAVDGAKTQAKAIDDRTPDASPV